MSLPLRQLERADLITEIEQGRRVELDLFRENRRSIRTLTELLEQRRFTQRANVMAWHRRENYVSQAREYLRGDFGLVAEHGIFCPCDECDAAVKRLLRACGVLPKGRGEL